MRTLIYDIWRLFRYYPLRSILSLFALILGMGTLTALMVIESSIASHSAAILNQQGARLGVSVVKSELHNVYVEQFVKRFEPEYFLVPYYSLPVSVTLNSNKLPAEIVAVRPELFTSTHWSLSQGRSLHVLDANNKVIVIGAEIAKKISEPSLSIGGEYFKIIGVLNKVDFDPILNFDPNFSIFLDASFAQHFISHPVAQDFVAFVKTHDLMKAESILRDQISSLLPRATIFIKNPLVLQKVLYKHIDLTLKTLKIISLITLFLGFISTLNLFLILLEERKSEMGLRLALGATMHDLGWQFFKETLLICVLGGCVGVIVGEVGAAVIIKSLKIDYYWSLKTMLIGIGVSCCVGGLVGMIPAIVAAKQSPIKLL